MYSSTANVNEARKALKTQALRASLLTGATTRLLPTPLRAACRGYLCFAGRPFTGGMRAALSAATSGTVSMMPIEPALQNNGVYDLFDAFAFVREVPRQKGYPDVYLLAAERLGLTASDCMVFEDIAAGIRGAKMGGFFACGVYEPASAHEAEQIRSAADLYLQSFGQLLDLFQGTLE